MLSTVFANFTHKQILTFCLTCKSWRAIMNDETLLKYVLREGERLSGFIKFIHRLWFWKGFPGSFNTLPSQVATWKELIVRQVGGDNYSKTLNSLTIPNTTISVQRSPYIPSFERRYSIFPSPCLPPYLLYAPTYSLFAVATPR